MAGAKKTSARAKGAREASGIVDRQLAKYRSMRDFDVTGEPSGKGGGQKGARGRQLPFVIQKHAASHLHYDFRLGWNGVLKSWACAKGPSYNPADRRLAVQVEDHPMEYGGFEGIIPAGQYGGGTVMLWDEGTWEPQAGHTDVDAGLRDGSLKFILHGTKMKGKWTLVRMGGKAANEKKPNWLLIKEHDEFERGPSDKPITEEAPSSVVTHRTLDEISKVEDHVWQSKGAPSVADDAQRWSSSKALKKAEAKSVASLKPPATSLKVSGAPKEKLPDFVPPQLASSAEGPPKGAGWLHELKLDGYRIQCRLKDGKVELLTRNGLDWTGRMRAVAEEAARLPATSALLDGEVVVLGEDGNTSFADLQAAFKEGDSGRKKELTYFVFDLLHLDGHNLRDLPLGERKAVLGTLLAGAGESVRLSEHLDGDAAAIFEKACELDAEGIVSKRADARYTSGRSSSWLKLKCIHEQEFVVGGFTLPGKGHAGIHGIGSLLLGYYNDSKELIYAGRTGTGFNQKTHREIRTRLEKLRRVTSPFDKPPAEARKGAIWTTPELVAQVRFATWTADNLLRQAAFQGLREDKAADEVRREGPSVKAGEARRVSRTVSKAAAKSASPAKKAERDGAPATMRLTHPDKLIDAESKLTKRELADYYWAIAPHMLRQIAGRPVSLVRCPDGTAGQCFFQKHVNKMLPAGVESVDVPDAKTGKIEPYITISTQEVLGAMAQIGVLELHPWGARNEDLEHPDRIIFDLDPDVAISWGTLAAAAAEVRKRLKKLGLESFLKSTAGKGLHVVAPVVAEYGWSTIKQLCHAFVLELEASERSLYLTKMMKSARAGKIYLDYLRNERGATAVAAFSPRSRAGAPVSMPLSWSELKLETRPVFRVADYSEWKARLARDPWKRLPEMRQHLTAELLKRYKIQPVR